MIRSCASRYFSRVSAGICHQPSARDAIQHGEFFGDAHRRIVERDRSAQHQQRDILRAARQRGRDQVGRGHQTVAVLMVLVGADRVETQRGRVFQ